jgi:hypothetical protein
MYSPSPASDASSSSYFSLADDVDYVEYEFFDNVQSPMTSPPLMYQQGKGSLVDGQIPELPLGEGAANTLEGEWENSVSMKKIGMGRMSMEEKERMEKEEDSSSDDELNVNSDSEEEEEEEEEEDENQREDEGGDDKDEEDQRDERAKAHSATDDDDDHSVISSLAPSKRRIQSDSDSDFIENNGRRASHIKRKGKRKRARHSEDSDSDQQERPVRRAKHSPPSTPLSSSSPSSSRRRVGRRPLHRSKLPPPTIALLRSFFLQHIHHPFPSDEEKAALVKRTHLTHKQVCDWFTNNRKRYWRLYERKIMELGCGLVRGGGKQGGRGKAEGGKCQCGADKVAIHDWRQMWD